jgi:hypothetical protein
LLNSETVPAGQTAIAQKPPLLLRGALNLTNLTYAHTNFTTARSFTLAASGQPGSEVEVVLGVDRAQMSGSVGALYAGILRFTDSLNLSQIDIAVSAQVSSTAGLWVGDADVSQVRHYLKSYEKDGEGKPVTTTNGQYVATSTNLSLGAAARSFPLRLIIHNKANNNAVLLQRVYYGVDAQTNAVISTSESALDRRQLGIARRISSIHMPWTEGNTPWNFTGELRQGGTLSAVLELPYDAQASNPFLHTYHPDHDNLDAKFQQVMPVGFESYRVSRQVSLTVTPPANDFASLTKGSQSLSGDYTETIMFYGRGTEFRQFEVRGAFTLNRISRLETLTIPTP